MNSLKMKTADTAIATWKRLILQRIFGPRKKNYVEWMIIITSSKWVLLQRLDPDDKVDGAMQKG